MPARITSLISSKFAKQTYFLTLSKVVGTGLSATWFVIAARLLDLEVLGRLGILLTLTFIVSILVDLGMTPQLMRVGASNPTALRSTVNTVLRYRLVAATACSPLFILAYMIAMPGDSFLIPLVFSISVPATMVYGTYTAALRSVDTPFLEVVNEVLSRALLLIIAASILFSGGGLLLLAGAYAVVDVISALVCRQYALNHLPHADTAEVKPVGLTLAAVTMAAIGICQRIDLWIISLLGSESEIGAYTIARRVADVSLLAAGAIALMSVAWVHNPETAKRPRKIAMVTFFVTAIISGAIFLAAPIVIPLVFGDFEYRVGALVRVLLLSTPFFGLLFVSAPVLVVAKPRLTLGLGITTLVSLLIGIYVGYLFNGVIGAAWGVVIAYLPTSVFCYVLLRD